MRYISKSNSNSSISRNRSISDDGNSGNKKYAKANATVIVPQIPFHARRTAKWSTQRTHIHHSHAQVKLEFQFDSLNLLFLLTFAICSRWRCITFNSIVSKFVILTFKYGCKSPGASWRLPANFQCILMWNSRIVRPRWARWCGVFFIVWYKDCFEMFGCSGRESQIIEKSAFLSSIPLNVMYFDFNAPSFSHPISTPSPSLCLSTNPS